MTELLNKGDHITCSYGDAVVISDDGEYVVCRIEDGRIITTPTRSVGLIPSPADIEAKCSDIRRSWSPRQEWCHTSPSDRHWPVAVQGAENETLPPNSQELYELIQAQKKEVEDDDSV